MSSEIAVLHTIAGLESAKGGPSVSVSRLCEALADQGVSVDLISQKSGVDPCRHIIPDHRRVHTRFVRKIEWPRLRVCYAPFLRRAILSHWRRKPFTIMHDHGVWLPSNHCASILSQRLGVPLIIHPRGMLEPWALGYRAWKKRIAWRIYQRRDLKRAALLVATSVQEAQAIRRVGLRQPIAIIPNGIDLPPETATTLKSGLRTALFVSRIHPKKGLLNLVAAWAKTRPEGWRVVVAGPDENGHRRAVVRAINAAGLQDRFFFAGPVIGDQKDALYRSADLFILPTFSENFGMVVAEALSYGLPVITTKGAPWESLNAHGCGWWVDLDVDALASAIQTATALRHDQRQAMGRRGRQYVEAAFSWRHKANEMMSVYMWVLGRCEPPACVQTD